MAKQELLAAIEELKLSIDATFVPWSKSRNAKGKSAGGHPINDRSLNWRVALKVDGREVLSCDYSAGIAHCPAYKRLKMGGFSRVTVDQVEAIKHETETGRAWSEHLAAGGKPILPCEVDVIWSLAQDADVINHATFEEWAENFGFDSDSRKAEATYRECLTHALALRNALGEGGLARLQEAGQDY